MRIFLFVFILSFSAFAQDGLTIGEMVSYNLELTQALNIEVPKEMGRLDRAREALNATIEVGNKNLPVVLSGVFSDWSLDVHWQDPAYYEKLALAELMKEKGGKVYGPLLASTDFVKNYLYQLDITDFDMAPYDSGDMYYHGRHIGRIYQEMLEQTYAIDNGVREIEGTRPTFLLEVFKNIFENAVWVQKLEDGKTKRVVGRRLFETLSYLTQKRLVDGTVKKSILFKLMLQLLQQDDDLRLEMEKYILPALDLTDRVVFEYLFDLEATKRQRLVKKYRFKEIRIRRLERIKAHKLSLFSCIQYLTIP